MNEINEQVLNKISSMVENIYFGDEKDRTKALHYLKQNLPNALYIVCLSLFSNVSSTRKNAVLFTQRYKQVETLAILHAIINCDDDPFVCGIARMVLGNCLIRFDIRSYDYIMDVLGGLTEDNQQSRQFAVIACGMIDEPKLMHQLYKIALDDTEDSETRWYALVGIGRNRHNPEVREMLIPFLSDSNSEIRHGAVVGLTLQKSPEVQKALSLLLHDTNEKVRYSVAAALLFQDCEDGVDLLNDAITGIDETRRKLAAHSISLLRSPKLDNALISAALNPNTELSWDLVQAITFSSKRIKPELEKHLPWVDEIVRERLVKLLWHLKWWDDGCIPRMRMNTNKDLEEDGI